MKKQSFTVSDQAELLEFLLTNMSRGRNFVKNLLARGQVSVDGKKETRYNVQLTTGQIVSIQAKKTHESSLKGVKILHEDKDIIVINKDSGLLTIASKPNDSQTTAHRELMTYVKQKNYKDRIFIVHRLDRDTSGVLIFAKNEQAKLILQNNWKEQVKERTYLALVEGQVKLKQNTITSWLKESETHQMYVSKSSRDAKKAVLHYQVLKQSRDFSLLKVNLDTGRKNQIRIQLASIGHPIVGDKKYRANGNPIKRLGLHAAVICFIHPTSKKKMRFEVPAPKVFNTCCG
ncbi:23S rRNA pseudouridine1911/1915/1917 synthase [Amphibacillus marinus]|uniref:Pseudouridine synthase n=1 Tax=Amphibacillus marinus TaxID=872970 RepID=A0A1H8IM74_9BACI|nr:RluA family pseudouridine synthase [Amphibacillus marinus]SEN69489.1 23S rRNA pseudouridine1911/1915/1917 synthase [Amphibacillus marinus]